MPEQKPPQLYTLYLYTPSYEIDEGCGSFERVESRFDVRQPLTFEEVARGIADFFADAPGSLGSEDLVAVAHPCGSGYAMSGAGRLPKNDGTGDGNDNDGLAAALVELVETERKGALTRLRARQEEETRRRQEEERARQARIAEAEDARDRALFRELFARYGGAA